jgi:hypothetical protein
MYDSIHRFHTGVQDMAKTLKLYDIPNAEQLGNWFQIDRVYFGETKRPKFRLTYENCVGGTIAHRFDTLTAASSYARILCEVKKLYQRQGRTVREQQ